MAAVPTAINGVIYPKNKTVEPYAADIMGFAYNPTLEVGGGPIIEPPVPPDLPKPPGDWAIWPPDAWIDAPEHPIVIPPEPPPVDPPATPQPPKNGWNWSAAKSGWYFLYVPGAGDPQPKRKR